MARAKQEQIEWSTFGGDLFLALDRDTGLRDGIEAALRGAIADGRLAAGTRLPSTRVLARDLGVSRGVVAEAYAHLAAGGWIVGRRGAGTTVGAIAPAEPEAARPVREPRHDLRPGRPDPSSFPREAWQRALRRALRSAPFSAVGLGDPQGDPGLRTELARYLARARGLRLGAGQIVVTTGFTQALAVVARVAAARGAGAAAMEEPCMAYHRRIVAAAGLRIDPLPVDAHGARVDELGGQGLVVLTPNRQHPLGMPLAPARRALVLERARAAGSIVVEDDYDGEFRYDAAPLVSLQGLDPAQVVYAGTTSKALAPGVRIGWLVVPPGLVRETIEQKLLLDWQPGVLDQLALAELMRSGEYDRHVRRMRLLYRRRRDALVAALAPRRLGGTAAGLNVLLPLATVDEERAVLDAAAARGVAVEGLAAGGYSHGAEERAGIVIGYAAAAEHAFPSALDALARAVATADRAARARASTRARARAARPEARASGRTRS